MRAHLPCISSEQYWPCPPCRPDEQEVAALKPHDLFPKPTYCKHKPRGSWMFSSERTAQCLPPCPLCPNSSSVCFYFGVAINESAAHTALHPLTGSSKTLQLALLETQGSFWTKLSSGSASESWDKLSLEKLYSLKEEEEHWGGPPSALQRRSRISRPHTSTSWPTPALPLFQVLLDSCHPL